MPDRPLHERATALWSVCTKLRRFQREGHHDAAWAAIGLLWTMRSDKNKRIAQLAASTLDTMEAALLESENQCCSQSSMP